MRRPRLGITACSLLAPSCCALQPSLYHLEGLVNVTLSAESIGNAAQALFKACDGVGTDEQKLIDVMGPMDPVDRNQVEIAFNQVYNKPLHDVLVDETSGPFQSLLGMISMPLSLVEYDIIKQVKKSLTGEGETNEHYKLAYMLNPLVLARTQDDWAILNSTFWSMERKDLLTEIDVLMGSEQKKVALPTLQRSRPVFNASIYTTQQAEKDADALYKAGPGRFGTDEDTFVEICVQSPPEHLQNISAVYQQRRNTSLVHDIKGEFFFNGELRDALLFYVRMVVEPAADVIADLFESTMKGKGTDELSLNAAMVRYYRLLPNISASYQSMYGSSLGDRIEGDTDRYHRRLLLTIYTSLVPYKIPAENLIPIVGPWLAIGIVVLVVGLCMWRTIRCFMHCTKAFSSGDPTEFRAHMDRWKCCCCCCCPCCCLPHTHHNRNDTPVVVAVEAEDERDAEYTVSAQAAPPEPRDILQPMMTASQLLAMAMIAEMQRQATEPPPTSKAAYNYDP